MIEIRVPISAISRTSRSSRSREAGDQSSGATLITMESEKATVDVPSPLRGGCGGAVKVGDRVSTAH